MLRTEKGPACPKCGGTAWYYHLRFYGMAICEKAPCDHSEGPLRFDAQGDVLPLPKTSEEALALHERFRTGAYPLLLIAA